MLLYSSSRAATSAVSAVAQREDLCVQDRACSRGKRGSSCRVLVRKALVASHTAAAEQLRQLTTSHESECYQGLRQAIAVVCDVLLLELL